MDQFDGIIAESLKPLIEGLRNARLSHNWSQADMAARSGISRSAYQNLENGCGNITLVNLLAILAVLKLEQNLSLLIPPTLEPIKSDRRRARRRKIHQSS